MAQIRVVEKRSNLGWLWGLIGLIIVAALVWYFVVNRRAATSGGEVAPVPADSTAPVQRKDSAMRPPALEAMPVADPSALRRARAVLAPYVSA